MKRLDIPAIETFLKQYKYTLQSNQYENAHTPLEYLCQNGHRCRASFNHLKNSLLRGRLCCNICSGKYFITIEQVRSTLQQHGCTLLTQQYQRNNSKLRYLCPKGHECNTTFNIFRESIKQGNIGCAQCGYEAGRKKQRLSIEYVRSFFKNRGCELLSKEYGGRYSKLQFKCERGHIYKITWDNFRRGNGCLLCSHEDQKRVFEEISIAFRQRGYKLLSTIYQNSRSKLEYECANGHKGQVSWSNFNQGHGCPKCVKRIGESKLGAILLLIFQNEVIRYQDRLDFLGRLHVDYSIRSKKIAFEYDGRQHFEPITYGKISAQRAEYNFRLQQERDKRKEQLCIEHEYVLIRFAYNEKLTFDYVKGKIENMTGCVL